VLLLRDRLESFDHSLFLGCVCIEDCCFLVFVKRVNWRGSLGGHDVYELDSIKFVAMNVRSPHQPSENPRRDPTAIYERLDDLTKVPVSHQYLSFGFYFSPTYDLAKPLHLQNDQYYDSSHFVWNTSIVRSLAQMGVSDKWMDRIVQGFFGTFKIPQSEVTFALLSRRSSEMGGTRFNSRGINEDGFVANFVESEQLLFFGEKIASFVQIRGSVPLFWKQTGVVAPPTMVKTLEFAQPYYRKHMQRLELLYGLVACVNLMSSTKAGECTLSQDFENIVQDCANPSVTYEHIDFHGLTENTNFTAINSFLQTYDTFILSNDCHTFLVSQAHLGQPINPTLLKFGLWQKGVIRTNCVDCLDRTNAFQMKTSFLATKLMLDKIDSSSLLSEVRVQDIDAIQAEGSFMDFFKHLWADNGDHISKIYTGTGATTSSTTRKGKGGLLGLLDHKLKSLGRFFIGNFEDNSKQKAINCLLGKAADFQASNDQLQRELEKLEQEFVSKQRVKVGILSWCAQLEASSIGPELVEKLTSEMQTESLDVFVFGLQDAVKSGGFGLFGSDGKEVLGKWEAEFSRLFRRTETGLRKFSSHGSAGTPGSPQSEASSSSRSNAPSCSSGETARTRSASEEASSTSPSEQSSSASASRTPPSVSSTATCLLATPRPSRNSRR